MSDSPPASNHLSRPLWQRALTWTGIATGSIVILVFAFYQKEKTRGEKVWERYRAEALARGTKLALAEYIPPPIPDERNFAAIPVFQEVFRRPSPSNPLSIPPKEWPQNFLRPQLAGLRGKNQPIDLTAWRDFFLQTGLLSSASDNAASDVLRALERYAPQWEQIRQASTRPECRFPVHYEDGRSARMPHYEVMRSLAELITLRLAAHLALQQPEIAYEDFHTGLRIYTLMLSEPSFLHYAMRLNLLRSLEEGVWGALARRQWTEAQLEKISNDLRAIRPIDDFLFGLQLERGCSNQYLDQAIQRGPDEIISIWNFRESSALDFWPAPSLLPHYPNGWVRLSQERVNRFFDEIPTRFSQEPPRVHRDRPFSHLPEDIHQAGAFEKMRFWLFLDSASIWQAYGRGAAYAQTLLDQTRLGCGLERYRLAQGSFPASLEPLVPAYLSALPQDVMTGNPLHYRTEPGGGYTLYSVGWDLHDDGGIIDPQRPTPGRMQQDWIWTMPAPETQSPREVVPR